MLTITLVLQFSFIMLCATAVVFLFGYWLPKRCRETVLFQLLDVQCELNEIAQKNLWVLETLFYRDVNIYITNMIDQLECNTAHHKIILSNRCQKHIDHELNEIFVNEKRDVYDSIKHLISNSQNNLLFKLVWNYHHCTGGFTTHYHTMKMWID